MGAALAAAFEIVWPRPATAQVRISPDADGSLPSSGTLALPPPGDTAWRPLRFRSIENPTRYEVRPGPMVRPVFRAESRCGASAMLLELPDDFDLARTPRLAWRWRVEQGLSIENERVAEGDDSAARVYVLHPFDPERATPWQRLEHRLGRSLFGRDTPGQTIPYVWSSQLPVGSIWTSPARSEARLLAIESASQAGASQAWREAIVDLAEDTGRLFSPAPRMQPHAIGLMTDSDDTCTHSVAWFGDFRLLGPAGARSAP